MKRLLFLLPLLALASVDTLAQLLPPVTPWSATFTKARTSKVGRGALALPEWITNATPTAAGLALQSDLTGTSNRLFALEGWHDGTSNSVAATGGFLTGVSNRVFALEGWHDGTSNTLGLVVGSLTSVSNTAIAALPKSGGIVTGDLVVTNAGMLSVGSTNPGTRFEVIGDGGFKVYVNQYGSLVSVANHESPFYGSMVTIGPSDSYGRLAVGLDSGEPFLGLGPGASARDVFLRRVNGGFSIGFGTTPSYSVNFTTDGALGLGGSPTSKLHVGGPIATSIHTGGGVTLGDTSSTYLLNVDGHTNTLPTPVGCNGRQYVIKLVAPANTGFVVPAAGTIEGAAYYSLTASNKFVRVQSDNANWWITGQN